jgi:hypothetical protein
MTMKKAFSMTLAATSLALLAGCSAENDVTVNCYDYSGNVTLREQAKSTSLSSGGILALSHYDGTETFIGSPQCTAEHNKLNADTLARAESKAKYDLVVTNGVDRILLTGKFSEISKGDYGNIQATLKYNDKIVRQVNVIGLPTIVTAQKNGMSDILKTAPAAP